MTTIIETLRNEPYNYNIEDTKIENVKTLSVAGNTLYIDTEKKPSEWSIEVGEELLKIPSPNDEVTDPELESKIPVHSKNAAREFMNDYGEVVLNEGGNSKPDNGFKAGGYQKFKEEKIAKEEYEYVDAEIEENVPDLLSDRIPRTIPVIKRNKPSRTIKGLTPRLAECGKIKIGKKGAMRTSAKGTQFRLPEKLDHFVITTMDKENDDFKQDEALMKKLGRWDTFGGYHCSEIPVRLPYDDPSLNFPTSYAYYDSAACQCRGDGEIATTSTGEIIECNPETCPNIKNSKCKPNGVLSLILDDAPRVGGVYKFRTTGWNSINNIFSSMEFIRGLTNGLLAGLPLMLTLTPKHTVIPGTKKATIIYMVNLEYRGSLQDMVTAIHQTMNTRVLMQYSVRDFEKLAEETLALPEAPEECKAIVEEFYPEAVKGGV